MKKFLFFILAGFTLIFASSKQNFSSKYNDYRFRSEESTLCLDLNLEHGFQFLNRYVSGTKKNTRCIDLSYVPTDDVSFFKKDGAELQQVSLRVHLSNKDNHEVEAVIQEIYHYTKFGWFLNTESEITTITTFNFSEMRIDVEENPGFILNDTSCSLVFKKEL